jgi:hypothetical protein
MLRAIPTVLLTAILIVASTAGAGLAADKTTDADAVKTAPKTIPGVPKGFTANLTIGECWKLGCTLTYDKSCPPIRHDIQLDNTVRCNCSSGSMCVNQDD